METRNAILAVAAVAVVVGFWAARSGAEVPHGDVAATPASSAPASPGSPAEALDSLDTRVAVPLLPMMANHQKQNMRDHLTAIQEIVVAGSRSDFAQIERAAGRIGYSDQMAQMCSHMGAGAAGFTEQALTFHRTADRIGDAARKKDMAAVWQAVGETLATCNGCHSTFKQKIVDASTWSAITGQAAPDAAMPHH